MSVWVTSLVTTPEVINLMLDKYKVDGKANQFSLFLVFDNGGKCQKCFVIRVYPIIYVKLKLQNVVSY